MSGVLDGHSLSRFSPGLVYLVDDPLGHQLIAMGAASVDTTTGPAIVIGRHNEPQAEDARLTGGIVVILPDEPA